MLPHLMRFVRYSVLFKSRFDMATVAKIEFKCPEHGRDSMHRPSTMCNDRISQVRYSWNVLKFKVMAVSIRFM